MRVSAVVTRQAPPVYLNGAHITEQNDDLPEKAELVTSTSEALLKRREVAPVRPPCVHTFVRDGSTLIHAYEHTRRTTRNIYFVFLGALPLFQLYIIKVRCTYNVHEETHSYVSRELPAGPDKIIALRSDRRASCRAARV